MSDALPYIVIGLLIVAVPLTIGAAIVKHRRDKAAPKVEAAPVVATAALAVEKPCPCGAAPTRALPRPTMTDLWIVRWWRRVVDSFVPPEVCEACGRYADASLDERIAETVRLARARMEAEIAREMAAHERALLGVVVEVLPEETRRAWARIQRPPAPQVRVLKAASEGGGEEGQS